ncbi:RagB/SusD family nutrient uptake outer membrane protein [Cellulophaga baltica]|uniref:RagB/SusD family nutrient uptake outer membrane protein n=1 Tax=Cellulophaga TaxID=104264 RepID=UPI001C07AFBF|nr:MULTISPECIES: RagB/SusD family nutrient uptake outer membrane protein [Cellulophaga]MBU2998008.1 RagB/SusD family nutrient uptake outer membrane protein [Cellulophaga baltica]MDO6769409.1 RagB/SusD family nutrient uptake outer membrane protein [Cellulophaga sp. 1_MG-2023]
MKKYSIITFSILILAYFSSCSEDFLEIVDSDEYSADALYQDEDDMENALNGLYLYLPGGDITSTNITPYFWTDDAVHRNINDGSGTIRESDYNWTTTSNVLDDFYKYTAIANINYFLEKLPDATYTDEDTRSQHEAEARFIRAYIYEEMLFAYGDVVLLTSTISTDEYPSRDDREEVFDFIISELEEIQDDLQLSYTSDDYGRITQGAVLALKARTYLKALHWYSDTSTLYAAAEEACAEIIAGGQYSLVDGIDGFESLFSNSGDGNSEAILSSIYIETYRTHGLARQLAQKGSWIGSSATFANNQSRPGYSSDFIEEVQTINGLFPADDSEYDPADPWTNRDPRLAVSVVLPGDLLPSKTDSDEDYEYQPHPSIGTTTDDINKTSAPTGYGFRKYIDYDLDALDQGDVDIELIRYAEVLLMYAEALAGQGRDGEALTYLDMVRDRVGMPKYADIGLPTVTRGTTGNTMIDAILLERRYEFAGEGQQRWWDIWRYQLGNQVITQVYGIPTSTTEPGDLVGEKYKASNSDTQYARVWDDKYYLLPISQTVLDANPNITQNEGW